MPKIKSLFTRHKAFINASSTRTPLTPKKSNNKDNITA